MVHTGDWLNQKKEVFKTRVAKIKDYITVDDDDGKAKWSEITVYVWESKGK